MSLQHYPKVLQVVEEGYEFDLGEYISRGFNIFKKNIGGFVGFLLLSLVMLIVVGILPFVGIFAMYAFFPIVLAGFYIMAHKLARDEETEFSDFFQGFQKAGQLILWYLVMMLSMTLLMIPMFVGMISMLFAGISTTETDFVNPFLFLAAIPGWTFLMLLPVIYLSVAWRWAPLFILFYDMNFWDAMEASRRIVTKKFWIHLLFAFILYILASVGYLGLLIGILFTAPAVLCMDYAAFDDVTRLSEEESESSLDNIEEHLVG